jgi:hypothetical protein
MIEIQPSAKGTKWNWRRPEDERGQKAGRGPGFDNRRDAIEQGRLAAGAEVVTVQRSSGATETYLTPALERVVLLRLDGSEVGELDPPPGEGGPVQQITLEPAAELGEAVNE